MNWQGGIQDFAFSSIKTLKTKFFVSNETSLSAAKGIRRQGHQDKLLCLNFASARNPGGGFLNGTKAQEEDLARASALYACIQPKIEYYQSNRRFRSTLYTHGMIYSPEVPAFRDDDDTLLDHFYTLSIVTAPAVNAGAVLNNQPEDAGKIRETMRERIQCLLSLALSYGYKHLILGAWGCGVFKNKSTDVAHDFAQLLLDGGLFENQFDTIYFAVLDNSKQLNTYNAFNAVFGE